MFTVRRLGVTGALLRTPRWLITGVFYTKLVAIKMFGHRRLHLGSRWANVGAPLVSFFDRSSLKALITECGGVVDAEIRVDRRRRLGLVVNERMGYVVRRPQGSDAQLMRATARSTSSCMDIY